MEQVSGLAAGENPLQTREDLRRALARLLAPLEGCFSPGCARLRLGGGSAHYPDSVAGMEGFCRLLWGLAPLAAGGGKSPLWAKMRAGLAHGTDPAHPEYWGEIGDYDQRIVEAAAVGYALALAPGECWEPLGAGERERLAAWLAQVSRRKAYDCNWLLFGVAVNVGLRRLGLPYDAGKTEESLARLEAFYLGGGWYSDGPDGHRDYYASFAIHFFCLFYAALMGREDAERAARYKARAAEFARSFILWFSPDGAGLPYGRSLTYRFAQGAFWGACAFAGVEAFPAGVLKGLVLRHLRFWLRRPIFDARGALAVGYGYPDPLMAESYNSPGSPYWALEAFLPLALGENSSFWSSAELPLPTLPEKTVQPAPRFVVCRRGAHVAAFNGGNPQADGHTHAAAKYEKFAYSTLFAFSVPRGEYGLGQGAYDSMLALSLGDGLYRVRRQSRLLALGEDRVVSEWRPFGDVTVRTVVLPGLPWHVRIHVIASARRLEAADGGFALGTREHARIWKRRDGLLLRSECGVSGVRSLLGGEPEAIAPDPDTNLLHPRTALPMLRGTAGPGVTVLAAAFCGEEPGGCAEEELWERAPCAEMRAGRLVIRRQKGGAVLYEQPPEF